MTARKKQTKAGSRKRSSSRKQASKTSKAADIRAEFDDQREFSPNVRFSATIHPRGKVDPDWAEKLAIDRLPDTKGVVRALVTAEECVRLLNNGFEVRLQNAYPVQPLDPKLIERDDSFKRWLDKTVQGIKGAKK